MTERRFPNRLNAPGGCKVITDPLVRGKPVWKPALRQSPKDWRIRPDALALPEVLGAATSTFGECGTLPRQISRLGSSLSLISSHISFWCSQMGSAFRLMNSSTSMPSIVGGRLTRFCFPWMKMVMNSCRRLFRSLFSAAVSFRLRFDILVAAGILLSTRCMSRNGPMGNDKHPGATHRPPKRVFGRQLRVNWQSPSHTIQGNRNWGNDT